MPAYEFGSIELAWAAGLFEGEGNVSAKRKNGRVYIRLAVTQHGGPEAVELLQRFADAVGHGNVRGPYDYSGRYPNSNFGRKPRFVVAIQSQAGATAVMEKLRPYFSALSPKITQYDALRVEQGARH